MAPFRKISCATDFSEHATRALDRAIDLARALGSRISIVHVIEPPMLCGPEAANTTLLAKLVEAQCEVAQVELARACQYCRVAGIIAQSRIEVGTAALTIVDLSRDAELLVMGTRGRTGLAHLLLGSVAERVVRHAHCPVLVVGSEHSAGA